jgi:hypothetical protein
VALEQELEWWKESKQQKDVGESAGRGVCQCNGPEVKEIGVFGGGKKFCVAGWTGGRW